MLLIAVVEVNRKDIVFLIDGTSALGNAPFVAIRDFIVKIIQRLEIGPDLIQVAVAQYADDAKREFSFNTYQTKKDVLAHVRKMRLKGGSPHNTGSALRFVKNNFFTSSAGSRIDERILQMLVLITGGQSSDDVIQAAQELKNSGILILSIGARNADHTELERIAYEPSLVFSPSDFRQVALATILPEVLAPIRTLSGTTQQGNIYSCYVFKTIAV